MEKQIKNNSSFVKITVSSLFLLALVFSSNFFITAQTQNNSISYTGEEIFRGVLFGDGPVASLFPEIWEDQKSNRDTQAWITLREQVISEIKTNDPNFMSHFGAEMRTGDHLRIDAIITEARGKLKSAQNATQDAESFVDAERAREAVKFYQRFIVIDEAAAVVRYVWIWVATPLNQQDQQDSSLYQEDMTGMVADRLAE